MTKFFPLTGVVILLAIGNFTIGQDSQEATQANVELPIPPATATEQPAPAIPPAGSVSVEELHRIYEKRLQEALHRGGLQAAEEELARPRAHDLERIEKSRVAVKPALKELDRQRALDERLQEAQSCRGVGAAIHKSNV